MFDQPQMRPHLVNYLRDGFCQSFPHKKVQATPIECTAKGTCGPSLPFFQLELFCEYLMPDTYDMTWWHAMNVSYGPWYHLSSQSFLLKTRGGYVTSASDNS